jgi:hypothetical protein
LGPKSKPTTTTTTTGIVNTFQVWLTENDNNVLAMKKE